jgi:multiple sugar transport system substrate-binding protein
MGESAGLTRRQLLAGAGAAGLAAAFGVASTGSPFGGGRTTIDFWNLFGGGDGARLTQMLDALAKREPQLDVRSLILPWGNPYYTKLSLAAVGGRPPDVAVMHATRLAAFAPAGLLEPLPEDALRRHGLTADRFLPKPWKAGQYQGTQYMIPLDTHPFVLYVNSELAAKADLLDGDGVLKKLDGEGALLDAFEAVKRKTGKDGVVFETRGVTPWRLFLTLYSQLGGAPILQDGGRTVALDDAKAVRALEWMAEPYKRKTGGADVDYQASVALFGNQSAAFLLNGEWEVTTFQAQKLKFDMRPVPNVFGQDHTQADSHTFVLPKKRRTPEQLDQALAFVASLQQSGQTWAEGGHVPAYKPVFDSDAYHKLQPQSHYASVAGTVVYDPPAWYSGSGSDLENQAGAAFQPVATGAKTPKQGLDAFHAYLDRLSSVASPVV